MVTATKAATPAANPIAALLSGMLGGLKTKLEDTAAALENGTANAANATAGATAAVGSAPNAVAAAADIGRLVAAVETHDWKDVPATLLDVSNRAIAILGAFRIALPELTLAQSILAKFVG